MHESKLEWRSNTGGRAELVYEPDGMPIDVPPGQSVRVVCRGTEVGELELDRDGDTLVVYGWPTSSAEIFVGDTLVYSSLAFPPLPPAMSTKQFLGLVFEKKRSTTDEPG